jgi:hypothetical protein
MKLTKYDHSVNYTCTVISLPAKQKVDGLDNLVRVEVFGNSCLIGKDRDPTDLYLFFPAESCLSETFLHKNNLYRESQLNSNTEEKGFFEQSGRVKALKMRGIISSGFVIPASSLLDLFAQGDAHYIYSQLKVGDEFNEIEGVEICRKYVSKSSVTPALPGSRQAKQDRVNNKLKDLIVPNQLRFHADTTHLAKNLQAFSKDNIIIISDKWHGSSCILAKVLINKKLNWFQKLLNKLGCNIQDKEFGYVYSSGKPKSNLPKGVLQLDEVQTFKSNTGDFYTSNIWKKAFDDYKYALEDGISIYSELVGFTEGGSAIQKGYDYGCEPGQYKMVVYRITYTKPDGSVIEFSWQQIKDYCKKYELETVKEFYFGNLPNWGSSNMEIDELMGYFLETLQTTYNMEKQDPYCTSKVPAEGLVVRIDGKSTYSAFKLKAKKFLAHETKDLDAGEVNMEDQG